MYHFVITLVLDYVRGKPFHCGPWWLLAMVLLLIGAVGMVAISVLRAQGQTLPMDVSLPTNLLKINP